jgi:outer membrane protein with beta-barrel domain
MRTALVGFALLAASAAHAENWSLGAGVGPFIFGHFVERTISLSNGTGSATTKSVLSAETRAGLSGNIEYDFNKRLAARLEVSWIESPLRIKSTSGDQGTSIDAGHMNMTTFVVPLVFRINPNGALRFDILGGPAYALYNVQRDTTPSSPLPFFEGTRGQWGGAGAVGVEWWWSRRFAVEWQAEYIVTSSPFRIEDFGSSAKGIHIPKPRNGHTTIGIRYRF